MDRKKTKANLVTVTTTQGMLRANVIRGVLEGAGIPVMLSYESIGQTIGLTVDGLGRIEIKVPGEWAKEAREILEAEPKSGEIFNVPPDVERET